MGNERCLLGARLAAGYADSLRRAGESGAGSIDVSASIGRDSGISRDARGRLSASLPGQDSELLELAFLGDDGWTVDIGRAGSDVYLGRIEVRAQFLRVLYLLYVPLKVELLRILSAPGRGVFLLRWKWLLAPILLGSVAAALVYHDLDSAKASDRQTTGVPSGLPLKLSVSENRNQLDVMWDRSVPAIVHANRGLLSISDGSNQQELELSGAQLRSGRVH